MGFVSTEELRARAEGRSPWCGAVVVVLCIGVVLGAGGCEDAAAPTCAADVPATLGLRASGIAVEVATCPFGLTVRDDAGRAVLASRAGADDHADGWGAIGDADGMTYWTPQVSPGYYGFDATLAWRDRWHVDAVLEQADDHLIVRLAPSPAPGMPGQVDNAKPAMIRVRLQLRPSALRVEAERLATA